MASRGAVSRSPVFAAESRMRRAFGPFIPPLACWSRWSGHRRAGRGRSRCWAGGTTSRCLEDSRSTACQRSRVPERRPERCAHHCGSTTRTIRPRVRAIWSAISTTGSPGRSSSPVDRSSASLRRGATCRHAIGTTSNSRSRVGRAFARPGASVSSSRCIRSRRPVVGQRHHSTATSPISAWWRSSTAIRSTAWSSRLVVTRRRRPA